MLADVRGYDYEPAGDGKEEVIILGGLDKEYCPIDPYALSEERIIYIYIYIDLPVQGKWELTKQHLSKTDEPSVLMNAIKKAERTILNNKLRIDILEKEYAENTEQCAAIESEFLAIKDELKVNDDKLTIVVNTLKENYLKMDRDRQLQEKNLRAVLKIIEFERKLQSVYRIKIEHLEKYFKKGEGFLMKLDNVHNLLVQGNE